MRVTSKLHKIAEDYERLVTHAAHAAPKNLLEAALLFLEYAKSTPHYVVESSLVNTVLRRDAYGQLRALSEAGLMKLPHDPVMLEMVHTSKAHEFCIVSGRGSVTEGHLLVSVFTLLPDGDLGVPYMAGIRESTNPNRLFDIGFVNGLEPKEDIRELWAHRISWAVMFVFLMQHVRGIAKDKVPAPVKWNKHRRAKGKREITAYTSLYIGRVEDKDGKSHEYTGRTMPVHMRAGHTRRQHHGPGNSLIKTVYIQPVLVNFNPGDEVPVPRRIVKMAS